jgi:hypothetical protein
MFEWKKLGMGAEGEVFRIDTNLVKKRWFRVFFVKDDTLSFSTIASRIKQVADAIPGELKDVIRVPELAGYDDDQISVTTYHEYIDDDHDAVLFARHASVLYRLFLDCTFGQNIKTCRGKIYLIDVAANNHT